MDSQQPQDVVPSRESWKRPLPDHLPRPTYWPAALALGVTVTLMGPLTWMPVSIVGACLGAVALVGWIGEIFRE